MFGPSAEPCADGNTREIHARHTADTCEIHARCMRDTREIHARYMLDTSKTYARYTRVIREIYARYTRDIREVHRGRRKSSGIYGERSGNSLCSWKYYRLLTTCLQNLCVSGGGIRLDAVCRLPGGRLRAKSREHPTDDSL